MGDRPGIPARCHVSQRLGRPGQGLPATGTADSAAPAPLSPVRRAPGGGRGRHLRRGGGGRGQGELRCLLRAVSAAASRWRRARRAQSKGSTRLEVSTLSGWALPIVPKPRPALAGASAGVLGLQLSPRPLLEHLPRAPPPRLSSPPLVMPRPSTGPVAWRGAAGSARECSSGMRAKPKRAHPEGHQGVH
jgi:hypothetical protein